MAQSRVVEDGETRSLNHWECNSEAEAAIQQGEVVYAQHNYNEAATHYRQALTADPECYVAYTHLGDSVLFGENDPAQALEHYSAAANLNPLDYRPHFFRGSALIRLGQRDAAVAAWRQTLALRPNYPILRQLLEANAQLGITMKGPFLRPRVQVSKNQDGSIKVTTSKDWMAYALCRALWLGGDRSSEEANSPVESRASAKETRKEKRTRKKREKAQKKTASSSTNHQAEDSRRYDGAMEIECLSSQIDLYTAARKRSQEGADAEFDSSPEFERLLLFANQGLLGEAITYDALGRAAAIAIPLLEQEVRDSLLEFVSRHVLLVD